MATLGHSNEACLNGHICLVSWGLSAATPKEEKSSPQNTYFKANLKFLESSYTTTLDSWSDQTENIRPAEAVVSGEPQCQDSCCRHQTKWRAEHQETSTPTPSHTGAFWATAEVIWGAAWPQSLRLFAFKLHAPPQAPLSVFPPYIIQG